MHISHLSLTNFRNYARLELDWPACIVLLQGDNAQGKTNLLEAIYCLSRTRSPRTSTERELVNWLALEEDLPFARLVAQVTKGAETTQIELAWVQSSTMPAGMEAPSPSETQAVAFRKHIRVNGTTTRAANAVGLLNAVLFMPEDIELVAGAPHVRRHYLDDTISQVDPRYYRELQHYERVLTQRNHLLKSLRDRGNDSAQLFFWDQRMVEHGSYITVQREQVIQQLDQAVQRIHSQLTGDSEHLRLEYCPSIRPTSRLVDSYQMPLLAGPATAPQDMSTSQASVRLQHVAASFASQLGQVHDTELEQGVSLVGPHRDDFRFLVNNVDMHTYGSRGQQRTIALSLKLAEVEWITQEKKDKPVLLLDDVFSELDRSRRSFLTQTIDQAQQVIITTNDLLPFDREFLARTTLWRVHAGRLEELTLSSLPGKRESAPEGVS